jgi:hypothetical protein
MKKLLSLLFALALVGCTGARKYSKYDAFEDIRVDQMSGNVVSGRIFGKTSLCLSARRETRLVTTITNTSVNQVTNYQVTYTTNLTISGLTNLLVSASTNAVAAPPPIEPAILPGGGDGQVVAVANVPSPGSTNVMITTSGNQGVTRGNNQTTINSQMVTQYNNQVTATTNNLTITTQLSRNITAETNLVIVANTNPIVVSVTNVVIASTNLLERDYYLLTELLPPPDFTLQSGESLSLLVDGQRHAFAPATPQGVFVARRGYLANFYRTSPEVLAAIANAREVRIRLRGVNNVIERKMPRSARNNLRKFMVEYFQEREPVSIPATESPVVISSSSETAALN